MAENTNIQSLLEAAKNACKAAGEAIMEIYESPQTAKALNTGPHPVTLADKTSDEVIRKVLSETGLPVLSEEGNKPGYEERKGWEYYWLVDPLDGTKEFLKHNGEFTVCIALVRQHRPVSGLVYAPCTDLLYYGSKEEGVYRSDGDTTVRILPLKEKRTMQKLMNTEGLRIVVSRSHISAATNQFLQQFTSPQIVMMGSSIKFMMLVDGKADLYPRLDTTMEWDTAASHAILNELNRHVYQQDLVTELVYNKQELANPYFIAF